MSKRPLRSYQVTLHADCFARIVAVAASRGAVDAAVDICGKCWSRYRTARGKAYELLEELAQESSNDTQY